MLSGNSASRSVVEWLKGAKVMHIDDVSWPDNKPCSYKLVDGENGLRTE